MAAHLKHILVAGAVLLLGSCAPAPAASTPATSPSGSVEAQSSASPSPATPAPESPPVATDQTSVAVDFMSLPPGTYPVHLHTICNGSQAFHITVLDSLSIGSDGTGRIQVPTSDAGRGWCVIVYGDQSLSRVLTTHPI